MKKKIKKGIILFLVINALIFAIDHIRVFEMQKLPLFTWYEENETNPSSYDKEGHYHSLFYKFDISLYDEKDKRVRDVEGYLLGVEYGGYFQ